MQDEMTLTEAQRRIGVQILAEAGELLVSCRINFATNELPSLVN